MEPYDLFISYAHEDNRDGWVEGLVAAINREHNQFTPTRLRAFLDTQNIRTMDDWEHRILGAIQSSKVMLIVVSPAYFSSPYCKKEWDLFTDQEVGHAGVGVLVAPIYATTVPELEDPKAERSEWAREVCRRQWLDLRPWRATGPGTLQRPDVRQRLAGLERNIAERIRDLESVSAAPSTVPHHNPNFVGRADELRWLYETLTGRVGRIAVLHGLPGMGKSALSFEYAHAYAREYPGGRFLLPAAGAEDLRVLLLSLAEYKGVELTIDERRDIAAAFQRVRVALERGPRCLVLLDNVDRPQLLATEHRARHLPGHENLHVIVTTRLEPSRFPGIAWRAVDAVAEPDALRLLDLHRKFETHEEQEAARRIVERLGSYTLAIEVVAVFLWQTPEVSYQDYAVRLEREGLRALDMVGRDEGVELSRHRQKLIGELLQPTLDGLTIVERWAVQWASLLPPDHVVLPWLPALIRTVFPDALGEASAGYPDPWLRAERRLIGLRLLAPGYDRRIARMHRLLQDVVRTRMQKDAVPTARSAMAALGLARSRWLERAWLDRTTRWEIDPLLSLAQNLLNSDVGAEGVRLAKSLWKPLRSLGRFNEVRSLLQRAITVERDLCPQAHLELAENYNNLGVVEGDVGNFARAYEAFDRAIALHKSNQAEDADLAVVYSNKAKVQGEDGQLEAARKLLLKAIAILEAKEPHGPRLANAYNNLAVVNENLGDFEAARALLYRAIAIDEKVPPPGSTALSSRFSNLALVERHLGHFREARELIERAIRIDEDTLDADHPILAVRYSNLALIERDLGNLAEARRLLQRSIDITSGALGPRSPTLAIRYANLGLVERDVGNLGRAASVLHHATELHEQSLDPRQLYLARAYTNLAMVEYDLGNSGEARRLLEAALAIQERNYPRGHPWLADTYFTLGIVEAAVGELSSARKRVWQAYEMRRRQTPDHPATRELQDWLGRHGAR